MNKNNHKKQFINIALFFLIITIFTTMNIVYSAMSSTLTTKGKAYARVESDVRITKYNIQNTENKAVSVFEEYTKNSIYSHISLPEATSTITYLIEVTNYGNRETAITNITGLPSNLKYTLIDYSLKDKICDEDNKCNNFAKKTFYLKISYSQYNETQTSYDLTLNFEFKQFYKITYTNISMPGPIEILENETLTTNIIGNGYFISTKADGKIIHTSNTNQIITIPNVTYDLNISSSNTIEYNYNGNYQTFAVPISGTYLIELYGASGGKGYNTFGYKDQTNTQIGKGAYTAGYINLSQDEKLYVYAGGEGQTPISLTNTISSFNAGSSSVISTDKDDIAGAGGGATDIRLVPGEWNNFESLKSRIMVAAGGGGNNVSINNITPIFDATHGGGPTIEGTLTAWNQKWTPVVTQTQGYKFGIGQSGYQSNLSGGGGGGGYYGGVARNDSSQSGRASGGTSFISGHENCDAISEESTETNIIHTGVPTHYSNKLFHSSVIASGLGTVYYSNWEENIEYEGNVGNGYAKITFIISH